MFEMLMQASFLSFPGTDINFQMRGLLNAFNLSTSANKSVLFIYSSVKHILSWNCLLKIFYILSLFSVLCF